MALVHTQDIAAVAARRLLALDFEGHSHVAVASEDMTLVDAAKILGAAIGRPDLHYVQFPDDQFKAAMLGMGASESLVEGYLAFGHAAAQGALNEGTARRPGEATPTTLAQFAPHWAAVFQAPVAH